MTAASSASSLDIPGSSCLNGVLGDPSSLVEARLARPIDGGGTADPKVSLPVRPPRVDLCARSGVRLLFPAPPVSRPLTLDRAGASDPPLTDGEFDAFRRGSFCAPEPATLLGEIEGLDLRSSPSRGGLGIRFWGSAWAGIVLVPPLFVLATCPGRVETRAAIYPLPPTSS
eukprot:Hpha_TRINITY_DN13049_c0_g1::TRINITY_DN13049_c0_g1_i1::g.69060::m.69060